MSEKKFENWIKLESLKVAKEVAYRNGQITGSPDAAKMPVLPDDYIRKRKPRPSDAWCWRAIDWRSC